MDFAIDIDPNTGLGSMTFDKADTIANNVWLSLMIDRGSWFFNPDFGSRLYLLKRAKNTERTAALAREYCREALQWLLDTGKATAVQVYSERDRIQDIHRLKLLVEVTQANGEVVSFETFVEVV
jgi:phage gp46-like protein